MEPNPSPKWCRQAVPEADLVFNHCPSDFQEKTFKILIIARCSENVKSMQGSLRKCSIFQRSHCQRTGSDDFKNAIRKSSKIASKINRKSMSEASVKRVLQLLALRRVLEGIFERLGAPNGPNMEPKGLPKWSQNRCQNRSRAEVASREGSGGPRDATSTLLEPIWDRFGNDLGMILSKFFKINLIEKSTYDIQHTACSIQHTACSIQHAAYSIQHTACSIQHTAQHTAYSRQHTAYSIQRKKTTFQFSHR